MDFINPTITLSQHRTNSMDSINVGMSINDIRIIIGGNFSADALGSDIYNATLFRIKNKSPEYLKTFKEAFSVSTLNISTISSLLTPTFLSLLNKETVGLEDIASEWLQAYNAILLTKNEKIIQKEIFSNKPESKMEAENLIKRIKLRKLEMEEFLLKLKKSK